LEDGRVGEEEEREDGEGAVISGGVGEEKFERRVPCIFRGECGLMSSGEVMSK
jgi:hypothetical protein